LALFPPHKTNVNQTTGLTTGPIPGVEQKIISSIKTFRKRNKNGIETDSDMTSGHFADNFNMD